MVPLSDAAVNHLTQLPHLRICHTESPPPIHSIPHSPLVFSPLIELELGKDTACEWLSLLKCLGGCVGPLSKIKESLKFLKLPSPTIDASAVSTIQTFHNLVDLTMRTDCHERRCIFKLNDDDITELAMALPQLEFLLLGRPCSRNTCTTTVACLLQISVHCVRLQGLEIHFNTTNIINDLKNIPDDPRFQELRSRPRCKLERLNVHLMEITLDGPGLETVMNGMIDIFPSLGFCEEVHGSGWEELSKRLWESHREMFTPDTP